MAMKLLKPLDMDSSGPLGLIAGWGSFPVELAAQVRERGIPLHIVGLEGLASSELESLGTSYRSLGLLKLGGHIRYFQSKGVKHVLLAGKIFKDKVLYSGLGWIRFLPDWTCWRLLSSSFVLKNKDGRDDTLLSAVVQEYERVHMPVLPITDVAPGLLVSEGLLTQAKLGRSARLDAEFGWNIARQMGGLDVGQSITVKDQIVLGVEAIEGTDALIERTARLCPRGGFTLVKVAKPCQDMRFDVPTIGSRTVKTMVRSGGAAIVVEAGRTILVEREETLKLANKHRLAIVAFEQSSASNEMEGPQILRAA